MAEAQIELRECEMRVEQLTQLAEYAEHSSWRCVYRSRYGECVCGLDDLMVKLGFPVVPVQDPERKEL
jgi:hypothetical protein